MALAFLASISVGPLALGPGEVLRVLAGGTAAPTEAAVIWRVRLPRALVAALVGASLASAGGAFQGLLRNPLADPYLLGVSGGAALGAVAALTLGLSGPLALPAAAFAGALGALAVVYAVARAHRASPHTLILSGVMVGSFAAALLLFLLWLAPSRAAQAAIFWLAGDLSGAEPGHLPGASAWGAAAFGLLWLQAPALDLFTQGEETAADLGLEVGRARLLLFAAAGGLTACAVALGGLVGFVGLVVPHAVRMLWGPAHRRLLPASAVLGAAFLLAADALARAVLAPAEVPVGVITALVGAPFFLYLLRRNEAGA
ncbi:MAG: iron ABC transporter permease [Deferrisomatales bacterium]